MHYRLFLAHYYKKLTFHLLPADIGVPIKIRCFFLSYTGKIASSVENTLPLLGVFVGILLLANPVGVKEVSGRPQIYSAFSCI